MARSSALIVSALFGLVAAPVASASDLHLKLKTDTARIRQGDPARVRLSVTARTNVNLAGAPVFIVANGSGSHEAGPSEAKGIEVTGSRVTPDRPLKNVYELTLPGPGTYTVLARYSLSSGVAESNKVTLVVEPTAAASGR